MITTQYKALDDSIELEAAANLFCILSESIFVEIVTELRFGEMSLPTIASRVGMRPDELLPDLLRLSQYGVVRSRRINKVLLYRLESPEIVQALDMVFAICRRRLPENAEGNQMRIHSHD
jgi:hypothetical protein